MKSTPSAVSAEPDSAEATTNESRRLNQLLVEMDGFGAQRGRHRHRRHQPFRHPGPGAHPTRTFRPSDHGRLSRRQGTRGNSQGSRREASPSAPTSALKSSLRPPPDLPAPILKIFSTKRLCLPPARMPRPLPRPTSKRPPSRSSWALRKNRRVMKEKDKLITSYHEAGHAIVSYFLPLSGRGSSDFHHPPRHGWQAIPCTARPTTADYTTKTELTEQICSLLGGRVAEKLTAGRHHDGCLQRHSARHRNSTENGHEIRYERAAGDRSFSALPIPTRCFWDATLVISATIPRRSPPRSMRKSTTSSIAAIKKPSASSPSISTSCTRWLSISSITRSWTELSSLPLWRAVRLSRRRIPYRRIQPVGKHFRTEG